MEFYFPTKVLKAEDYSPVQVMILKEYYKDSFNRIIEKVFHIFIFFLFYFIIKDRTE